MSTYKKLFEKDGVLIWLGALISALAAVWINYQSRGTINNDGLLYVKMAGLIYDGNWREAVDLLKTPLYPGLMALVHGITGFDFQISANILSVIFFSITCSGLMVLVRQAGGDRVAIIAVAILFLISPYIVRSILPMVVRDHGFWAMQVWSFVFFLRFMTSDDLRDSVAWGVTAMLATLFRIEGMVYLLLLPVVFLLQNAGPMSVRVSLFLKINVITLLVVATSLVMMALHPSLGLKALSRIDEPLNILNKVTVRLLHDIPAKSEIYGNEVLEGLQDFAMPGLIFTIFLIVFMKTITSAGWLQLIFAISFKRLKSVTISGNAITLCFGIISLCIMTAIFVAFSKFVLSKRYVLSAAFVILVLAAFGLSAMYARIKLSMTSKHPYQYKYVFLGAIAIVLQAVAVYRPSNSFRTYEIDAAKWVTANTQSGSKVYFDTDRLRYYAGQPYLEDFTKKSSIREMLSTGKIHQYDYVVGHANRKDPDLEPELIKKLGFIQIASFDNRLNDKVVVYKLSRVNTLLAD